MTLDLLHSTRISPFPKKKLKGPALKTALLPSSANTYTVNYGICMHKDFLAFNENAAALRLPEEAFNFLKL